MSNLVGFFISELFNIPPSSHRMPACGCGFWSPAEKKLNNKKLSKQEPDAPWVPLRGWTAPNRAKRDSV
jgi:hypothetical protein